MNKQPQQADQSEQIAILLARVAALEARPPVRQTLIGSTGWSRLFRAAIVASLLTVALGTRALASVPDAGNVYHGCLSPLTSPGSPQPPAGNYVLTIIDTAKISTCPGNKPPITWNQAGQQGPIGPKGDTGAQGIQGPKGDTGAVGVAQYAYMYNLTPQVVLLEADVPFDSNGIVTPGFTHVPGTSAISVVNAGVYLVTFSVSSVEPNQFALFLNGAPVAGAVYGSGAGTQQNNGQAILALAAGDTLTLRNHTSAAAVVLQPLAGGVQINANASLVIEQLH